MKKQTEFPFLPKSKLTHGGELAHKKRKTERPLKMNKPIHIVLRAKRSGLKTKERKIEGIIKKYADKFNIKIYQKSINSNHIHIIISAHKRVNFQNFLRSITGLIARIMKTGKLWLNLAFTRVASWGKEYKILAKYVIQNQKEALGLISYQPRPRHPT